MQQDSDHIQFVQEIREAVARLEVAIYRVSAMCAGDACLHCQQRLPLAQHKPSCPIATLQAAVKWLESGKAYWAKGDLPLFQSNVELDENHDDMLFIEDDGTPYGEPPIRALLLPLPEEKP